MIKRLFYIFCFLLFATSAIGFNINDTTCDDADSTTWCIQSDDSTLNDSDCGGSCDSGDTIYLEGGSRGYLIIDSLDGVTGYITIKNDPGTRVLMGSSGAPYAALEIRNSSYVDVLANNLSGETYGILITNTTEGSCIRIRGTADHIKVGYIEMTGPSLPDTTGNGIFVQDGDLGNTTIWSFLEFHHNYIHDVNYAGMYLGQNHPNDDPYISDVSVHDNILEDIGAYGITLKGVDSGSGANNIYNNILRGSAGGQSTGLKTLKTGEYKHGIGVNTHYGSAYSNIYDNYISKTVAAGIRYGRDNHNIYNNIIVGCATGNEEEWAYSGIHAYFGADGAEVYDNIIIDSSNYGIYATGADENGTTMSRNLIGGSAEFASRSGTKLVESAAPNANVYYASVSSFNFDKWSDDSNYTNDVFYGRTLSPADDSTGMSTTTDLSWTLFAPITNVSLYFEDATPPTVLEVDDAAQTTFDPGTLVPGTDYYYYLIYHDTPEGDVTGDTYHFTTAGGPPTPEANKSAWKYSPNARKLKY